MLETNRSTVSFVYLYIPTSEEVNLLIISVFRIVIRIRPLDSFSVWNGSIARQRNPFSVFVQFCHFTVFFAALEQNISIRGGLLNVGSFFPITLKFGNPPDKNSERFKQLKSYFDLLWNRKSLWSQSYLCYTEWLVQLRSKPK